MGKHSLRSPGRETKTPAASKRERLSLVAGAVKLSTEVVTLVHTIVDHFGP